MTITLNKKNYGDLLTEFQPQVISSEDEYNRVLEAVEKLMWCENITPEQQSLLELLAILIELYEDAEYPIKKTSPNEVLLHLMEVRELRQADLVGIIGSRGVVSEVINGKRAISKTQAKKLGEFFNVSPELFI
jgi:HTH-type transcriptional regulator / antitoxin HigA